MKPLPRPVYVTRPILPDLRALEPHLRGLWESRWLTNHGELHDRLEAALRTTLGVSNASVFNNGTIALLVAIKALDLAPGTEIITTPFTFPATPHCISWNGLRAVFSDIEPATMTIDPARVEELITDRTSAILGVHVYGFPCHLERLEHIANKHNLRLIYDAAHAFNTTVNGKGIGSFGDISMFSFHPTKLFHTLEGGCLVYGQPELERKVYYLRNFGIKNEDEVVDVGINGKMNELQAAIGLLNLQLIENEMCKRRRIRTLYETGLSGIEGLHIPKLPSGVSDSCQYFVIRIDERSFGISRNRLYDRLKEYNIISRKYFSPLCSDYVPYRNGADNGSPHLPVASLITRQVLCLPFYGELTDDEVEQISGVIRHLHDQVA
jgi:dTDP-4-amino-4,6-dideoxygalactose transaminase